MKELCGMQIKKDDIRATILKTAKEEFFGCGFKNTSMRKIAQKSEVSLSNIYNYFRSKDEILREILTPLLTEIEDVITRHNSPENISTDVFESESFFRLNTMMLVSLTEKYKPELKLLLIDSEGSYLENYKEELISRSTTMGREYLNMMKEKYAHLNIDISDFFIHVCSSWWITVLLEVVSHKLTKEDTEKFISEYIRYGTAGWKKLMKV